jgi:hypothetical protein
MSDEMLKYFNLFLCKVLYFPLSVAFTTYFVIVNAILMPPAYVFHSIKLA